MKTSWLSNKLVMLFSYLVTLFTPIAAAIMWLGVFMFFNFATSIWKNKKQGERITSKKLSETITSTTLSFMLIICSHVMDKELLTIPVPVTITQIAIAIVSGREYKKLIENISAILGVDLHTVILSKLGINFNKPTEQNV